LAIRLRSFSLAITRQAFQPSVDVFGSVLLAGVDRLIGSQCILDELLVMLHAIKAWAMIMLRCLDERRLYDVSLELSESIQGFYSALGIINSTFQAAV
jgi:hypothetical protein